MVAHADLIGPLDPHSSQGHTHALCIVDACTRWPSVYLLRALTVKPSVIVLWSVSTYRHVWDHCHG